MYLYIIKNPVKEITRLAEFLGKSYEPSFIETVRAKCSFDSMRDRKGNMDATSYGEAIMYRKGEQHSFMVVQMHKVPWYKA